MATAKKRDPAKWARAKAKAKAKMGGKHSARAMQLAVKYYKQMGGRYSGKKSSKNKLTKWSKQKWDYVTKGDEKNQKRNVVVTYLNQLGKVSVPVKKQLRTEENELHRQKENNALNTQNESQEK